jgi:hypothetical protein
MSETTGNRRHKDSLFRVIFKEKQALLSLYNAINQSDYQNPEELEVTTIEDILYMGMKNDVSFLIDSYINLYEAQSTWNPNMPLRGLFYFSRLYAGYVSSKKLDIYSSTQLKLPTPQYIVFYNGTREEDERTELRLSSSYIKSGKGNCLECVATVLNINYGHNEPLMQSCRLLYEYSYLVRKIREFVSHGQTLESAIDMAVADCIENGILEEFLLKHRAEVKMMILSEYNEELHLKNEREIAREEGIRLGKEAGRKAGLEAGILHGENRLNALYQHLIHDNRFDDLKRVPTDRDFQEKLMVEYNINI